MRRRAFHIVNEILINPCTVWWHTVCFDRSNTFDTMMKFEQEQRWALTNHSAEELVSSMSALHQVVNMTPK